MDRYIQKRDERKVAYDRYKIHSAIEKAVVTEISPLDIECIVDEVEAIVLSNKGLIGVEIIQDTIENVLISRGYKEVVKRFMSYRESRTEVREKKSKLMRVFGAMTNTEAIDLNAMRENANVDANTSMGLMLKYGSEGSKEYTHNYLLNKEHSKAHKNGDIHIHDLDFYSMGTLTCCQIPFDKLIKNGFSTGHGAIRETQDISTYAQVMCIAIQSNQNEQHRLCAII